MEGSVRTLEEVLALLSQLDKGLQNGGTFESACESLNIDEIELREWANRCLVPPNAGELLSADPLSKAVFPIFAADAPNAPLDHIGSGVIIQLGDELFALTAAHVTDQVQGGNELFMPGADGIEQMSGGLAYTLPLDGQSRSDDKGDIAYYRLAQDWNQRLHPSIYRLAISDLMLDDALETGDLYTFAGFPWRKTKKRRRVHATDFTTYTGHVQSREMYERLGYSRRVHVVIRMRRKKTFSSRSQSRNIAPHPQGISGGAVLAWPWAIQDRFNSPRFKLAAIGHTYHPQEHVMAGTRVITYLMAIINNNPHLAKLFVDQDDLADEFRDFLLRKLNARSQKLPPVAMGIAWYTAETYARCLQIFDDAPELPVSFDEWRLLAERTEAQLIAEGARPLRVHIDPDTFPTWCAENGFAKIDKDARMAFGSLRAAESVQR